jgi:segregation and condensation protein A
MYNVRINQFEGPLNLLLELIEDRKISINEISLAEITEEYLNYVRTLDALPQENIAEFLDIASALILIKSKSLLPSLDVSEEDNSSIEELQRRLNIYKAFKRLALVIEERIKKNEILFARPSFLNVKLAFIEPKNANVQALREILKEIISFFPTQELLPQRKLANVISLDQKIKEIQARLQSLTQISFSAFAKSKDKLEAIISFLAILELMKQGFLSAKQEANFGEIRVIKI